MHANRNKSAVKRVEKGMMKATRTRNLFAVFAIVLTTFMITTVFSLGINYMEHMKLMQVRTAGTPANVSLAMPTAEQEQPVSYTHLTILDADRILVVDDGRVVGQGTHQELLKSCTLYREIAEIQLGKEAI